MQSTSSFLTQNEKDILKSRHRQERDKRLCDRIKSILLLYSLIFKLRMYNMKFFRKEAS